MSLLKLRFKATRGKRTETFTAVVDSGADVTTLNQDTACELGLDMSSAPTVRMQAPGGVTLIGFELHNVHLKYKQREATLSKIFVPHSIELEDGERIFKDKIPPNDEQLIGHDFLQAAKAKIDYSNHTLQGRVRAQSKRKDTKTVSVRPPSDYGPATPAQRIRLRAAVCRIKPKRKR